MMISWEAYCQRKVQAVKEDTLSELARLASPVKANCPADHLELANMIVDMVRVVVKEDRMPGLFRTWESFSQERYEAGYKQGLMICLLETWFDTRDIRRAAVRALDFHDLSRRERKTLKRVIADLEEHRETSA